jgi:RNA polymerase primary sigma factor
MTLSKTAPIDGELTENNSNAELLELGREQGHVSLEDVVRLTPEHKRQPENLEEIFEALSSAGIALTEEEAAKPIDAQQRSSYEYPVVDDLVAESDVNDLVRLYMNEAASVPLLTAEEEVRLAKAMERGVEASQKMAGGVSAKDREALLQEISDGWDARQHLIVANSRLVISIAKKSIGRGLPLIDLIQEGNIGLMRSAKKFDYRRGFKFSTYATWWIRQAITRALSNKSRTIRIPAHMGDRISKLMRTKNLMEQQLHREPTIDELADRLGIPHEEIELIFKSAAQPQSLESPIGHDGDSVLGELIEDQSSPSPEDSSTQHFMRESLAKVIDDTLPLREARILRLRFGMDDGHIHSLSDVGRKIGVTRERVRQIEAQALSRLRDPRVKLELDDYIK